jgi:hypothetical protein
MSLGLAADIYSSKLEKRLVDLREAETALAQAQGGRQISEDKFQKVFHASPIPFSITTLQEGRFVDVMPCLSVAMGIRAKNS